MSGGSTHEICRREKTEYLDCHGTGNPGLIYSLRGLSLVLVLYKSVLSEDGQLSFAYFTKFFARKYYWSTLVGSFKVTILSTVVAAFLGLVMAYVLRSVRIKGSKYLNILIVISYLSPPFIGAYAWIQLLGRNGFFTKILNGLFHVKLGGIYGFAGIVLVFSLQSFPLVYMYISGALKNLDNSLNEAAESLGCTAFQRVMQIIVPLVMPTMLASSLLVFMRVFSDFGTPMLIGEGYKTFPVLIYSQFMGEVSTDDHFAAALCVIVIVITLVLFFLQRYLGNRFTYSMTALKPMEAETCTGARNILSHLFVYAVVLVAILPQITVIITSFLATGGGTVYTGGFSLENYRNTLFSKNNNSAIFNTYLFGLCAIAIVVVLGILISYLTVRKNPSSQASWIRSPCSHTSSPDPCWASPSCMPLTTSPCCSAAPRSSSSFPCPYAGCPIPSVPARPSSDRSAPVWRKLPSALDVRRQNPLSR